jgi:hypothetical protein
MVNQESTSSRSDEANLVEGVLESGGRSDAFLRDLKRHLVPRGDDPVHGGWGASSVSRASPPRTGSHRHS